MGAVILPPGHGVSMPDAMHALAVIPLETPVDEIYIFAPPPSTGDNLLK